MSKLKSRLFGVLFIIILIACVFLTMTPVAGALELPEEVVQQTPVPDQFDADTQMDPGTMPGYDQPGVDAETQFGTTPGIERDMDGLYDEDVEAEMEPELMTQQQRNAQSVFLWILVALGFALVAVLITISIMRNRDRRTDR